MTTLTTWEQHEFTRPNCYLHRKPGDYLSLSAFLPSADLSELIRLRTWADRLNYPPGFDRCAAALYDEDLQRFPLVGTYRPLEFNQLANPLFESFTGTADDGLPDDFHDWDDHGVGSGDLVEAVTTAYAGNHAVKLTHGNTGCNIYQSIDGYTPGQPFRLTFYTRGDGSVGGSYGVYDLDNDDWLIPQTDTDITGTDYTPISLTFNLPAGCTEILLQLFSPAAAGSCYYDAVTLSTYDATAELMTNTSFEDFTGDPDDGDTNDFTDWVEYGTGEGDIVEAVTIPSPNTGTYCVKITYGNNGCGLFQDVDVLPNTLYKFEFYTKGDYSISGRYAIRDLTADQLIVDTTVTGATWPVSYEKFTIYFTTPDQCVSIRLYLISPESSGYAVFDDVSLVQGSDEQWIGSYTINHLDDGISPVQSLSPTPNTLAGTHKQNFLYIFDKCLMIDGDANVAIADHYTSQAELCYEYGDALALLPALDRIWLLTEAGDLQIWSDGPVSPLNLINNGGFETNIAPIAPTDLVTNGNFSSFSGTKDDNTTDIFDNWTNHGAGTYDLILAVSGPGGTDTAVEHRRSSHPDGDPTGTGSAISQTIAVTPETLYTLEFQSKGDGSRGGFYRVRDNTNGNDIIPPTAASSFLFDYATTTVQFMTPPGCVSINLYFIGPDRDGSAFFAYASLKVDDGGSYHFTGWTRTNEGPYDRILASSDAHSGDYALEMVRDPQGVGCSLHQHINTVEPGLTYRLRFFTKGDGTRAGRYMVRDRTNGLALVPTTSTGVTTSNEYVQISVIVTVPRNCEAITLYLFPPASTGSALFDDVELSLFPAGFEHWHTSALDLSIRHILHYRDYFVLFCRAEDGSLMIYRLEQRYPVVLIATQEPSDYAPVTRLRQIAYLPAETGFYQPHAAALDWSVPHVTHQDQIFFSPGAYLSPDPVLPTEAEGPRRFAHVPIYVYNGTRVTLVEIVEAPIVPDTWGLLTWRGNLLLYFIADEAQHLYLFTGDRFTEILATDVLLPDYSDIYSAGGELLLNTTEPDRLEEGVSFLREPTTNVFTSSWLDMDHPTADKFLSHVAATIRNPADLTAKLEYRIEYQGTTSAWTEACTAQQRRHLAAHNIGIRFHLLQLRITLTDQTDKDNLADTRQADTRQADTRLQSLSATYSYGIK